MSPGHIRPIRAIAVVLAAGLLAATVAMAKEAPRQPIAQIMGRTPEAVVISGKQSTGLESGVTRSIANVNYRVAAGTPEAMARQYLRENASKLQLADAQLNDLIVRATRRSPAGTTVRFEQQVQGIPVLAPDIAVTIDSKNTVTFVMSGYQPGISVPDARSSLSGEVAAASVKARLGVSATPAFERTRLVISPEGKSSRLAYEVRVIPSTAPHGEWQALVDATTGEIFQLQDIALYVNGTGFVFDPDPLGTAHATYGQPGYTDGADATTPQLDAARSSRTLLDITDIGGGVFKLQGPYATIVDTESPFNGLFTQASTTFNYNRLDNAFEAVNCYYHVDKFMRYINTTLGLPLTPYQYAGGVRFDPSGLSGADNSHYTSGNGVIAFGEGGVDDAEDADVVIHELGHGIHDWVTAGGLSQVNGLSEGTGDYVCQSYSRALNQWASNEAPYQWTFSWDGHNEFWPGRITNHPALYPGGLVGQIHTDGQIWATCLMRIWDRIGQTQTDKAVIAGLGMTNSSTNQNQAALAVLQAAISMGYSSADITAMVQEMRATGYTVSEGVDYVSHAITDECSSNVGNVNGILEPGESAEVRVTLVASTLPRTGVSGILTSLTPGVSIINAFTTWPNLAPGVPTMSAAPHFRIVVDAAVACASVASLRLTVSSNEGAPIVMNFSQPIGSSLDPSGLPLAIPDNVPAGVTSTLGVPSTQVVNNLKVRVQITHTWVGDLFIKLRSPAGTEVVLLDRPGVPATGFGCANDNMDVTFDDASAVILENHCAGTTPWFVGNGRPTGLLSAFNGQSTFGNWVLTVSDNAGTDLGTLTSWQLITTPPLVGACNVCDQVVATRLAYFAAEDQPEGIQIAWEFSDATDVTSVVLERASVQVGPWEPVAAEYAANGTHTTALDRSVRTDQTYFYRLLVTERNGSRTPMDVIAARHALGASQATLLFGASPNPAPRNTSLAFRLSQSQLVHLSILDAQGRRVRTLEDGVLAAGDHARFWDGVDASGKQAPAGLYFAVMHTQEGRQSSRFVMVR